MSCQKSDIFYCKLFIFCTFVTLTFLASSTLAEDEEDGKGNGFGEQYNWVKIDDAFSTAKDLNKPVMLLIHKTWCGACKALKPQFAASKLVPELSENFVMVNTKDDEEPSGDKYTPDGGYIPRILFYDSDGELLRDIINESGNPGYKYFYNQDKSIADSMKRALSKLAGKDNGTSDNDAAETDGKVDDSEDDLIRVEL